VSIVNLVRPGTKVKILAGERVHWVFNHKTRADYLLAIVMSAPPWVDRGELNMLRAFARAMTIMTGSLWVLDHIIPVTHPHVCGLTVPWNLRVVPWRVNAAKSNNFNPDQMELFENEQREQALL
jgi:hypothetical protein